MNKFLITLIAALLFQTCFAQRNSGAISRNDVLSHNRDSFGIVELRSGGFQFINPLLDCYQPNSPGLRIMKILEKKLKEYLAIVKEQKKADLVSVYYRDLSNGPWLGINEEETYSPASLLKVPVLIAALKYSQSNPDFLSWNITYYPSADTVKPEINTGNYIQAGQTYTIYELLERMIIYSDNEAKNLILNYVPADMMNEIFFELGIDVFKPAPGGNFMSVKEFASFFRILYNASYLDKAKSEIALSLLSKTNYNKGITAGLPPGMLVAHKFGERTTPENLKQLHDCGIIYKENQPYLLCVMTRGHNYDDLQSVITGVSKIIYEVLKTNL